MFSLSGWSYITAGKRLSFKQYCDFIVQGTLEEWRLVYMITAVMLLATCAIYCITAKGERQVWDYQDDETPPETTKKKRVKNKDSTQGDQDKREDTTLPQPSATPAPPDASSPERQKPWWWPFWTNTLSVERRQVMSTSTDLALKYIFRRLAEWYSERVHAQRYNLGYNLCTVGDKNCDTCFNKKYRKA